MCSATMFPSAAAVLVCVGLFAPFGSPIEVHEDVNEGPPPIGAHLRVNASIPHTNATALPGMVNERNVNDLPHPPYHPGEQSSTTSTSTTTSSAATVATNFTTFPSNHKQHSGASAVHGQTSSPLATEVVAIAGITSSFPATPPAPSTATSQPAAGLSSFRAANGHLYPGRGTSAIVNDRAVQHQISGYRKRQLYASAAPQRNVTNGSSEGRFTKEFIPSPEVIPFFNEENTAPGSATTGTVDAPYPTGLSDGDSRWYAGGMGLSSSGYASKPPSTSSEESGKWDHKYTWTTPSLRHQHQHQQQQNVQIKFPHDATPHFPSPKGKWKWVPEEEENESTEGIKSQRPKVSETPFSSAGSFEEHPFGRHQYVLPTPTAKKHPYSFDRTPTEGAFSVDPAIVSNSSSSGVSSGVSNSAVSTESSETSNGIGGLTDVKLIGKEDAHLKGVSPWKKIIHVLRAAIPIGLLISALTPQVVYINPNATQPPIQLQTPTPVSGAGLSGTGLRQRSLGQDVPRFVLAQRGLGADPVALVKLLRKLNALEQRESSVRTGSAADDVEGMNRLMDTGKLLGCDWKLLCQLARQGMSGPGTDAVHKMLWKIVSETPSEWTGRLGLEEIFRIIREGDCDRLQRTCDQDT